MWSVWALTVLAALVFVANYGSNLPNWDEWFYVPILTGEQPADAAWLWAKHNEHHMPLPKLVWLSLLRLTDYDFRAGMFLNVLVLGALAFALILTAKNLRGSMSYADAFFPLALLNLTQDENLLWSWQIQLVLSTALACVLLVVMVRAGGPLALKPALLAGACLVLLPLCGANGLALVPALALWLGYTGFQHWRFLYPHGRRNGLLIWGLTAAAVLLVSLSFQTFQRDPDGPPLPALGYGTR